MSDEELVRALYVAWSANDRAAVEGLLAPEVEWIPDPRTGQSVQRGREAVVGFIEERAEMFDSIGIDAESIEADEGRVLALIRITGEGSESGASFDISIGHVWDVRDGLIVRGRGFGDRGQAEREFRGV